MTIPFIEGKTGLTIHCNYNLIPSSLENLEHHAKLRKYYYKADDWHGICISPINKRMIFGIQLKDKWEYSKEMKDITDKMAKPLVIFNPKTVTKPKKIGANEMCSCGSGQKYKRCCRK